MKLTRYMDINKYKDLLSTKTLFLPRYDILGDPYEGCLGHIPIDKLIEKQTNRFSRITAMPLESDTLAREFLEAFEPILYHDFLRKFTFVSCWHQSDRESMPMWKMYAERGIMIKTDLSSLCSSLGVNAEGYEHSDVFQENHGIDSSIGYDISIESGNVNYIPRGEYIEPIGSDRYFRKQLEYADERELRVILQFHLGPEQRFNFPYMFDNTDSTSQDSASGEKVIIQSNFQFHLDAEQRLDIPVMFNDQNFPPKRITDMENRILSFWRNAKSSYEQHASILERILVEPRVRCPVEVDTLIKEVVISPNSTDSDVEEIEVLNHEFGIGVEVKRSEIEIEPSHAKFSVQLTSEERIELEL